MAIASLVFAIAWIAGIGSIVAIILGFRSRRKTERRTGAKSSADTALAGIVLGFAGLVFAAVFWVVLPLGNGGNAVTSSPSYIDGSAYATTNYSNNIPESTLCAPSNISSGDSAGLWTKGCQDGWATARFAINNGPGAGLNVGG